MSYRSNASCGHVRMPDSRYRMAVQLVEAGGRLSPGTADRFVGLARRYLENRKSIRTRSAMSLLESKMSATAAAFQLAFDGGELRESVEARILAGDPPEYIAHQTGVPISAIEMFEKLFFDVRTERHRGDYILQNVIGPPRDAARPFSRDWRTVKLLGWLGGPLVVDELLCPGRSRGIVESPEKVADDLSERSREILRANAAVFVADGHLGDQWKRQLSALIAKSEFEHGPDHLDTSQRNFTDNVVAFLEDIDLTIGRRTIPPENEKYYSGATEPRAGEWQQISRGEVTTNLEERIERGGVQRRRESEKNQIDSEHEPNANLR